MSPAAKKRALSIRRMRAAEKKRARAVSYLRSVWQSCAEGYSGEWDCSSDEGKEGFEAMQYCLLRAAELLGLPDLTMEDK